MGKYFRTSKNGIEDKQTGIKGVKFFPIKTHQFINVVLLGSKLIKRNVNQYFKGIGLETIFRNILLRE